MLAISTVFDLAERAAAYEDEDSIRKTLEAWEELSSDVRRQWPGLAETIKELRRITV